MKPAIVASIPPYKKQSTRVKKRGHPQRFRASGSAPSPVRLLLESAATWSNQCWENQLVTPQFRNGGEMWWDINSTFSDIFWPYSKYQRSKKFDVCRYLSPWKWRWTSLNIHPSAGGTSSLDWRLRQVKLKDVLKRNPPFPWDLDNWGWDSPLCGVFIWYTIWLFNRAMEHHHV